MSGMNAPRNDRLTPLVSPNKPDIMTIRHTLVFK